MSSAPVQRQPPLTLRIMIFLLGTLLTFLLVWLLGFLLRDIGNAPGPDYGAYANAHVDPALAKEVSETEATIEKINQQLQREQEIRDNASQSMQSAREAIDKMVDLHRLSLEKGVAPSAEQQTALAESQRRFLETQAEVQKADAEKSRLASDRYDLQQKLDADNQRVKEQSAPAEAEYAAAERSHSFKIAAFKLAAIVPIFLLSGGLTYRYRRSAYRPIFLAALIASFWKIGVVMHEHFPSEFFKYIAILAAIAVTLAFLVRLLRIAVRPRLNELLKRYREGYDRQRCPVCGYPMRRGPHRHAVWDGKGPRSGRGDPVAVEAPEAPYNCPSCGTTLFEACGACGKVRHSLLPFCESCGAEFPLPGLEKEAPAPHIATPGA